MVDCQTLLPCILGREALEFKACGVRLLLLGSNADRLAVPNPLSCEIPVSVKPVRFGFLELMRLSIRVLERVQIDEQSFNGVRLVILEVNNLGLAFLVEHISISSICSRRAA